MGSDYGRGAVIVTSNSGRHRFTYKGPPSESRLKPLGACTNALSHILVCDWNTGTVHILSKDGDFLSYLLKKESPGIYAIAHDLSYKINSYLLWVVSVSVYRYIDRHLDLTG